MPEIYLSFQKSSLEFERDSRVDSLLMIGVQAGVGEVFREHHTLSEDQRRSSFKINLSIEHVFLHFFACSGSVRLYSAGVIIGPARDGAFVDIRFQSMSEHRHLSVGAEHALLLDHLGQRFAIGLGDRGQLGVPGYEPALVPLTGSEDILWCQISAGAYHNAGIGANGRLYTWGDNSFGQLGLGHNFSLSQPTPINEDQDWALVTCGRNTTLALKKDGSLWGWGDNGWDQLGREAGDEKAFLLPRRLNESLWTHVVAGDLHVLALDDKGELFAWGCNTNNQAHKKNRTARDDDWACRYHYTSQKPYPIPPAEYMGMWMQITAGFQHSVVSATYVVGDLRVFFKDLEHKLTGAPLWTQQVQSYWSFGAVHSTNDEGVDHFDNYRGLDLIHKDFPLAFSSGYTYTSLINLDHELFLNKIDERDPLWPSSNQGKHLVKFQKSNSQYSWTQVSEGKSLSLYGTAEGQYAITGLESLGDPIRKEREMVEKILHHPLGRSWIKAEETGSGLLMLDDSGRAWFLSITKNPARQAGTGPWFHIASSHKPLEIDDLVMDIFWADNDLYLVTARLDFFALYQDRQPAGLLKPIPKPDPFFVGSPLSRESYELNLKHKNLSFDQGLGHAFGITAFIRGFLVQSQPIFIDQDGRSWGLKSDQTWDQQFDLDLEQFEPLPLPLNIVSIASASYSYSYVSKVARWFALDQEGTIWNVAYCLGDYFNKCYRADKKDYSGSSYYKYTQHGEARVWSALLPKDYLAVSQKKDGTYWLRGEIDNHFGVQGWHDGYSAQPVFVGPQKSGHTLSFGIYLNIYLRR
jgi:hypothetical protein